MKNTEFVASGEARENVVRYTHLWKAPAPSNGHIWIYVSGNGRGMEFCSDEEA